MTLSCFRRGADLYSNRCNPGIKLGRIIKVPKKIVGACRDDPTTTNFMCDVYTVAVLNPEKMQPEKITVPSINVFTRPRFPISKELRDVLINAKVKERWE